MTAKEVDEWVEFMKSRGIRRVVSMLSDDELTWYAGDLDAVMNANFEYARTSVFVPGALSVLDAAIEGAIEDGQPFVTHCSGGGGRVSIMLSLWLHRKHGLSAEAAAAMIEETAKDAGTRRAPNPSKLVALLEAGQL